MNTIIVLYNLAITTPALKSNSFILFVALIQTKSVIICELVLNMHPTLWNGTPTTRETWNACDDPAQHNGLTNDRKADTDSSKGEKPKRINLNALNPHINFLMQE